MRNRLIQLAAICFIGTLTEVAVLYIVRTRGNLGFKFSIHPNLDLFRE